MRAKDYKPQDKGASKMLNIIVKDLLEYVDVDESMITEDTQPANDLHLNSYDYISLVGKLEDDLGITISERDLRDMRTLGDLDEYIQKKMLK